MKSVLSWLCPERFVLEAHHREKNHYSARPRSRQATVFIFAVAFTLLSPVIGNADYCTYPYQGDLNKDNSITFVDTHEGQITRTFDYYIPPQRSQLDPQDQPPLVFIFHGHGSSANDVFGYPGSANMAYPWCRMMKYADEDGFIICAPDGWLSADGLLSWNDCRKPSSKTPETNDILFTQKLLSWFIDQGYNIDQNRIYAAGFSNGGGMVIRLAAEMDDRIAAVASVCALTPLAWYFTECSEPDEKTGVLIMNGTEDPLVNDLYTQALVDYCTDQNGLTAAPTYIELPTDPANPEDLPTDLWADLYRYESAFSFEPTSVFHYAVHGAGHCEPSKLERYPLSYTETWGIGAGPQCADFEVAEEVWNFFKMHVLREERVYRPTSASVVTGSGAGDVTDLWIDEDDGNTTYMVDDDGGTTMLAATFTIPDPQPLDSLRFTIVYQNTIAAMHSVSIWNYTSGPSGNWEQIGTDTYTSPGTDATINEILSDSLTHYVNAQQQVTVALCSDNPSAHQLSVALMEIGVTLKNLDSYADGDTDYDGTVDGSDLYALAKEHGKILCTARCSGDCNNDDAVNGDDVTVFAADFGQTAL